MKTPLLLAALVALPLSARERTTAELCAAAQEALSHNTALRAPGVAGSPIQILQRKSAVSIVGYADGGYAVIGNDDQLPAVLGYSDGVFSNNRDNYNFHNFLDNYDGYLAYCAAEGIEPRFIGKKATFNPEGVKEIMTCRWDQGGPYNWMSPFVYVEGVDKRCITGCVATAMAQIIYTLHKNFGTEIRPRGIKRYSYTDANKQKAREMLNFTTLDFDWDNMRDTYSGNSISYIQGMAVARLMYACGVASEMQFTPGASGSYASTAANGINAHFEGIYSGYSGYNLMAYEQDIYDAFDKGYPVLITGADKDNNGHAFVGDGYDKNGKVHLNFGWSGAGDNFFTLVDMGGYINYQTVNIITPEEDGKLLLSHEEPIEEVADKYITADFHHPAEEIEEGKWYVLYNVGRDCSIYSPGLKQTIMNFGYIPAGDEATTAAPMVVRFIKKTGTTNQYYIQTGTGDYFGGLINSGNSGAVSTMTKTYTCGHIQEKKTKKYFWFKQGTMIMDCNAPGGGLAGWGTATPNDTLGNNSWQLLPVILSDQPGVPDMVDMIFDTDHKYSIMNYDGSKNYYLGIKATSSINKTFNCEIKFVPAGEGWHIVRADDETQILGNKAADFKLSNSQAKDEAPLTCYFEPEFGVVETGDEVMDACSSLYRIRCEAGYLATEKTALGSPVFSNKGPHADFGRWLVTDRTAYEALLEGIVPVNIAVPAATAPVYDLQGRRVETQRSGHLYISGGKKVFK